MPRSLKCPTCNAPLEITDAELQIDVCEFCGNRILLSPDDHRDEPDGLIEQARNLQKIKQMAQSGNMIEAIKLFRSTFGVGLKEAKEAVEGLASRRPVVFTQVSTQSYVQPVQPAYGMYAAPPSVRRRPTFSPMIAIVTVLAVVIGIGIFGVSTFVSVISRTVKNTANVANRGTGSNGGSNEPNGLATEIFRFGGEGIGAGKFKDNRTVAIDGDGNVFSADYTGKAIQKFDSDGKFLTQWELSDDMPILKIAADRKGHVYLLRSNSLTIFDSATGKVVRTIPGTDYRHLAASTNGSLYALSDSNSVLKLDANGKVLSKTGNLIKQINFEVNDLEKIAADGSGNLYAADSSGRNLLKFSPDGKFLFRFDSTAGLTGSAGILGDLAVDNTGKGRVYSANAFFVLVYDVEGSFLGSFTAPQTFGLTVDDKGALWTASRPFIVKYEIGKIEK